MAAGVEAISFRLGALVAGAMALHTYTDLIRSPHRPVLDPHPVEPVALLQAIALETARTRLYLALVGAVVLAPVAVAGHLTAWAGGALVVAGAWLAALGIGFTVHLAGVWAAFSPALARLLDLLRGDNPRMQAALIYAPGVALALVGGVTGLAAAGVRIALLGQPIGWILLGLPPLAGLLGAVMAAPLARRYQVRATALLAEIDGMYAVLDPSTEARHVYFEWLSRGRREWLRALRQGWRARRGWATGAWGLGLVGFAAGWSRDPGAPLLVLAVVGGAGAFYGLLPTRLAAGDPPWLDRALGVDAGQVTRARAMVAFAYVQGALIPGVLALLVRQGSHALLPWLGAELLAGVGASLGAALARRYPQRSPWLYGPMALLCWAGVLWGLGPLLGGGG